MSESLTTIDASFADLLSSSLSPSPRDSASMSLMSTVPVVDVFGNQTSRPVAWTLQEGYISCYYEYGGARSQYCLSSHLHQWNVWRQFLVWNCFVLLPLLEKNHSSNISFVFWGVTVFLERKFCYETYLVFYSMFVSTCKECNDPFISQHRLE